MPKPEILKCPSCGAPIARGATECPYCLSAFVEPAGQVAPRREPETQAPSRTAEPGDSAEQAPRPTPQGIAFRRVSEPNENAFTLSVPEGWQTAGGVSRANFAQQAINAQYIEAKIDFAVKRDPEGTVVIRWCPETKYRDMRFSPAGMMGMFGMGGDVGGLVVSPLMGACQFLAQVAFHWAHPQATDYRMTSQQQSHLLVQVYQQKMAAFGIPAQFEYDGGIGTFVYTENGRRYEEKQFTVIESMGMMGGGMWSNKDTMLIRAPEGELAQWEPLLHRIRESVVLNPQWVAGEIVSQEFLSQSFLNAQQAEQARSRRALEIQQHIQQMDRQIAEHRMRTNEAIQDPAYLTMVGQEEYVNPFTDEPETGSNEWEYRWVTDGGEEYYTDVEDDDPSVNGVLDRSDWRRSPVRRR